MALSLTQSRLGAAEDGYVLVAEWGSRPAWRSRVQTVCGGNDAEVAVDQIRAISKLRLMKRLDRLSAVTAAELRRLITEMYGG